MVKKEYYKNTVKNVLKIFEALKTAENREEDLITVSKLAKLTNLHKWTVSRTLDIYMQPFVEIVIPEGFEDVGLHIKFVRLKNPKMTREQLLRFIRFRSILKSDSKQNELSL